MFLDEIGEMTPGLQAKLLRFLEDRTFKRVGGLNDIRVDVRVIAATNRSTSKTKSRPDGFAKTCSIDCRSCRCVFRRYVSASATSVCSSRTTSTATTASSASVCAACSQAAQALLDQYRWPGNVRELRNAIERAMLLADNGLLGAEDFATLSRSSDACNVPPSRRGRRPREPSNANC